MRTQRQGLARLSTHHTKAHWAGQRRANYLTPQTRMQWRVRAHTHTCACTDHTCARAHPPQTLGVYNGSTGIVVGMDDTQDRGPCVVVQLDDGGRLVKLREVTFNVLEHEGGQPLASRTQIPLKLGYACTVHCAQGMSLTRGTCDLRDSFTCGQAYTAVSRFRSFEHVVIHRADTIRSASPDCVPRQGWL